MAFTAMVFGGFEQGGAQRRRQGQRHKHRKRHRRDDGDGELTIDHARGATEEGHGDEHGRQRHANTHQCGRNFRHGLARGFLGRLARLVHHALDVLDHHNRIIHQQANGQHHAKHGQRVDGVTGNRQHAKRTQQHHGHGNGRNQGSAEVLQEDEHHDHHQHHGLAQSADHFVNRRTHKRRGVRTHKIINLVGEKGFEFSQLGRHRIGHLHGIGTVSQNHAHTRTGHAVELGLNIQIVCRQLYTRHIAHRHHRAIGG